MAQVQGWPLRGALLVALLVISTLASVAHGKGCDWTNGTWVWDDSLPLYTGYTCSLIQSGSNCGRNGRQNMNYQKWRWQPSQCNLKRVTPAGLTQVLAGKTVFVAGDSISKNFDAGLECILAANKNTTRTLIQRNIDGKIYYGSRFMANSTNITTHSIFANNLNRITDLDKVNNSRVRGFKISLDEVDPSVVALLKVADVLVLTAYKWWTIPQNEFYLGGKLLKGMAYLDAFEIGLRTIVKHLQQTNFTGQAFLLSPTPTHYNIPKSVPHKGLCQIYQPLNPQQTAVAMGVEPKRNFFTIAKNVTAKSKVRFVDITQMSAPRADAHMANLMRTPGQVDDCLHWCEGGVPDAWVGIIYNLLLSQRKAV